MEIHLHNTLSGKKEIFKPIKAGEVSMYNCGPTVYNYAHIGNLRSYIFADTLRRMFKWNGYKVKQVINITDVGHLTSDADFGEDKMEKGAKREGKSALEISKFYTEAFFDDLQKLNIEKKDILFPRATDYIAEQIEMIKELEQKGFTYQTSDGIYFDTAKFPDYGKLGNINLKGLEEGSRIGVNDEKKNITDFALWKFSPKNEKREMEWPSPWGVGFPGWHIECSAMSKALLGQPFDLHTGGIDHIPVHHNNEIAQSVCASGLPFVHYWMHNAFLNIGDNDEKMAKSGENFIRLQTLVEKNIDPLAYRYLLLTARYSSPLQFSWEALEGAQTALNRLKRFVKTTMIVGDSNNEKVNQYKNLFSEYINDDLDTPKALALVWDIIKDDEISDAQKKELILDFDKVFGLELGKEIQLTEIPTEVSDLISARDRARAEKDWKMSDELRQKIENLGFNVKDTPDGTMVDKS